MDYLEIETDDIDELFQSESDRWRDEIVQLTPGALGFRSRVADLGGVTLTWNHFGQSMHLKGERLVPGIAFGLLVESRSPVFFEGELVEPGAAVLWCKRDRYDNVISPHTKSLIIELEEWLVASLGWKFIAERKIQQLLDPSAESLISACEIATERVCMAAGSGMELTALQKQAQRVRVIDRLRKAVQPWIRLDTQGGAVAKRSAGALGEYCDIVQNATRAMVKLGFEKPLVIKRLAYEVGVSERTLYRAFENWVGMAPTKYFLLWKLHQFRSRLLKGDGGRGAVTRAAMETGFNQLGRLSGAYKKHFGETPGETLRRRGKAREIG